MNIKMKHFLIIVVCAIFSNCRLLSQNIGEILYLYDNAISNWESSSPKALPYFEKLYDQIEPLYNKYYTNNLKISEEIHKISRNYIRFMNEYYLKGFGGKQYIENAWKMSQSLKGYEALKEYNTLMLLNLNNRELLEMIDSTDLYNYSELRRINKIVDIQTKNILFLETPTIKEIQDRLQGDDLYLSFSFSLNERSFFIVTISKKDVNVHKSKMTTYELFNRIAVVKGIITKDNDLVTVGNLNLSLKGLDSAETLEDNLRPLEMEINKAIGKYRVNNIIVENDIIISQIPFDVLKSNTVPFYKKYHISYVPNASYYVKLQSGSDSSRTIVGISPELNEEDIIIEQEIELLKGLPYAKIMADCSKDEFLTFISEDRSYDIFHLSSHFNKEYLSREIEKIEINGMSYYLENLSKKEGYFSFGDSHVSVQDVFSHNRSKAKTLVLSGCETATSDDVLSIINPLWDYELEDGEKPIVDESHHGEEISMNMMIKLLINQGCYCNSTKSFDNLFLMAISFSPQHVIAFQNIVGQESSWNFFNEFYINYQECHDTKQAFFQTKRSLMELEDSHFYDYASIILVCK